MGIQSTTPGFQTSNIRWQQIPAGDLDSYISDLLSVGWKQIKGRTLIPLGTDPASVRQSVEDEAKGLGANVIVDIKGGPSNQLEYIFMKNPTMAAAQSSPPQDVPAPQPVPSSPQIATVEFNSTTQPATAQPATAQPATAQPATAQPVTAQPVTTQPATTQPVTAQPVTTQPATTQPATTQPATTQPVTTQPVTTQPATTQPVTTQPATTQPATTQPVTAQPATAQPVTTQPATTQPATTQPATTQPATTQPATTQPTATQPATAQPATTQLAATQPATTQPVTAQPATTQPATTQPATTQPATTQPATTQPATTQPATTQPAATKPATAQPATAQLQKEENLIDEKQSGEIPATGQQPPIDSTVSSEDTIEVNEEQTDFAVIEKDNQVDDVASYTAENDEYTVVTCNRCNKAFKARKAQKPKQVKCPFCKNVTVVGGGPYTKAHVYMEQQVTTPQQQPIYSHETVYDYTYDPRPKYQPQQDQAAYLPTRPQQQKQRIDPRLESSLDHYMEKLTLLLYNNDPPVKFYDTGEYVFPKVTLKKNAYVHLGNRPMHLIMLKEGVHDYKIIGNELQQAGSRTLNPRMDELYSIKTVGTPTFTPLSDLPTLTPPQLQGVIKGLMRFLRKNHQI